MNKWMLVLIIGIALNTGCLGENQKTGYANPDALVDASWVSAHLSDSNLKIISATGIKDNYDEGHISSSLYVDYKTDIVDLNAAVENQMATKEKVQGLLKRLGIKNSDTIVVYDNTNNMIAARMYNVLRFYGHMDVRLLNGGESAWIAQGKGLTTDVPTLSASDYSSKDKNPGEYVDLRYVYNNLNNPDVIIVDVRPVDQYTGVDVRPGIGRGGGHLPGAINVPGSLTWNDDKTIKSFEELKEIYESAGVSRDKRIVVHCHNGMLASYSWFILSELLGYPDVALYDGSALEFTNHPDIPLIKGIDRGSPPMDLKPLP